MAAPAHSGWKDKLSWWLQPIQVEDKHLEPIQDEDKQAKAGEAVVAAAPHSGPWRLRPIQVEDKRLAPIQVEDKQAERDKQSRRLVKHVPALVKQLTERFLRTGLLAEGWIFSRT